MGEIADLMINGDMCQFCGEPLDDGNGYPQSCGCCDVSPTTSTDSAAQLNPKKTNCPQCGKRVKKAGLQDHIDKIHGKAETISTLKAEKAALQERNEALEIAIAIHMREETILELSPDDETTDKDAISKFLSDAAENEADLIACEKMWKLAALLPQESSDE